MLRTAAAKVAWVGRATVFLVGLSVILALVLGVATMALAAVPGDPFKLGQSNVINAVSALGGNVNNSMLRITNNSEGPGATALNLQVTPGKAPMKVNSATKVASLNADRLDGKDISAFDAEKVISDFGPLPRSGSYTSKGGTLIISASGSGFRSAFAQKGGLIGMGIVVDGTHRGISEVTTNERDSHKAFVTDTIVVEGLAAGSHSISLQDKFASGVCNTASEEVAHYCTTTNADDTFYVTVVEIPD
jgi:hypothetical protein